MKTIVGIVLVSLISTSAFAAPAYPLDELLLRAKLVCIAKVTSFDDTHVSLEVQSKLRGDLATTRTFKVDTSLGTPEKGSRYFVFSQGHDRWGKPKDEIKLSQGIRGQGSYCGWFMLPIQNEKGVEIVRNAFSSRFRKPEEGIGPLTLEQARQLVGQTRFKGQQGSEPSDALDRQ